MLTFFQTPRSLGTFATKRWKSKVAPQVFTPGPPFVAKSGNLYEQIQASYILNQDAVSATVAAHQDAANKLPAWKKMLGEKVIRTFNLDMDRIRSGAIAGTLYYEMCKQQGLQFENEPLSATAKFYYEDLQLPRTFSQWFQITALHVWMLFVRMRAMPKTVGREYQQKLVDSIFRDMEKRLSLEMRISSTSIIDRYRKDFNLQLRGSVMSYDEGFILDDATLASALWRNFFSGRTEIDPTHLEQMVHYIRTQLYVLENISDFDFSRGRFHFINPALHYKPLSDADIADIKKVAATARNDAEVVLPSDKTQLSNDGW